ncbi:MAG: M28 family peptidase, partial [Bacteroidia bacterium]|nr:M28 family peptidase [Bacteroidia bacterium]
EEIGLIGSKEFVKHSPVALTNIALNINLDMVSRNEKNELYLCGGKHYPQLIEILDSMQSVSRVRLRFGHDSKFHEDWTNSSDHSIFHQRGIPFAYFGVEDHQDYHTPKDRFENIQPVFFTESVRLIIDCVQLLDKKFQRK